MYCLDSATIVWLFKGGRNSYVMIICKMHWYKYVWYYALSFLPLCFFILLIVYYSDTINCFCYEKSSWCQEKLSLLNIARNGGNTQMG